jgi:hypothetical protein
MDHPPVPESAPVSSENTSSYASGNKNDTSAGSSTGGGDGMALSNNTSTKLQNGQTMKKDAVLAHNETRRLWAIKAFFVLVLTGFTVSLSIWVYKTVSDAQQQAFEVEFNDRATKILNAFQANFVQDLTSIDSLGLHMTSSALHSDEEWPFFTLPDFDIRGASARQLSKDAAILVTICPLVTEENREAWQGYAMSNQWWIREIFDREALDATGSSADGPASRALFGKTRPRDSTPAEALHPFPDSRHVQENNATVLDGMPELLYQVPIIFPPATEPFWGGDSPGPYMPAWQSDPVLLDLVNYDVLSSPQFREPILHVIDGHEAVLGSVANATELASLITTIEVATNFTYNGEPISFLYHPIMSDFTNERQLVGVTIELLFWPLLFSNILPEKEDGYVVVLENGCEQAFTFEVDGPSVSYEGAGDLHDHRYDGYVEEFDFRDILKDTTSSISAIRLSDDYCPYTLRVYPSQGLEDIYITKQPLQLALFCSAVFVFTALLFLFYDWYVLYHDSRVVNSGAMRLSPLTNL